MKSKVSITMSWDDGSPHDLKLADLLNKYGLASTFYIPKTNSEGRQVLCEADIRCIAQEFEVAAHTLDHVRLNSLSSSSLNYQIGGSKRWLEDVIGSNVYGFCYPGGVYDDNCIEQVKEFGFYYARTTENFCNQIVNRYEMPTTLQFYNHNFHILLYNMLKSSKGIQKLRHYYPSLTKPRLYNRSEFILDDAIDKGLDYIHFWGHSWELEDHGYWKQLEDIFKMISDRKAYLSFKTNYECATLNRLPGA